MPRWLSLNLKTDYRERRLAGLDVQNNLKCPSSPVARRGLFRRPARDVHDHFTRGEVSERSRWAWGQV